MNRLVASAEEFIQQGDGLGLEKFRAVVRLEESLGLLHRRDSTRFDEDRDVVEVSSTARGMQLHREQQLGCADFDDDRVNFANDDPCRFGMVGVGLEHADLRVEPVPRPAMLIRESFHRLDHDILWLSSEHIHIARRHSMVVVPKRDRGATDDLNPHWHAPLAEILHQEIDCTRQLLRREGGHGYTLSSSLASR